MPKNTKTKLKSSAQVSPANPIALQDSVRVLVMNVIYGVKSSVFCGRRNPDGSWGKTCQDSLVLSEEDSSAEWSMTWPKWATVLDGECTELVISEQSIAGRGFSSLPTPTCFDTAVNCNPRNGNNLATGGKHNVSLKDMVPIFENHLLPTPRSTSMEGTCSPGYGPTLRQEILSQENMLLTPRASQAMCQMLDNSYLIGRNKSNLEEVIANEMLPTPQAFDSLEFKKKDLTDKTTKNGKRGGRANLREVDFESKMLPTPTANSSKNNAGPSQYKRKSLPLDAVLIAEQSETNMLPTPATSQDYKPIRPLIPSERNGTHGTMLVGAIGSQSPGEIGGDGKTRSVLNPLFVEAMMGFPKGWTSLE